MVGGPPRTAASFYSANMCIIIDSVNNTKDLEEEEIDALLIEKRQFWIGTLHTYPFGLNSAHDLHRKTRKNIPDD